MPRAICRVSPKTLPIKAKNSQWKKGKNKKTRKKKKEIEGQAARLNLEGCKRL
jgi:hypothetical protein